MSEFKSYLSDETARMFRNILKEMQNYSFEAVNFPIFLYGILCANENGENALSTYFALEDIAHSDVEDQVSLMISDHCSYLQDEYEKEQKIHSAIEQIKTVITFPNQQNQEIQVPVDELMAEIMEKALQHFDQFSVVKIDPIHFIPAMFEVENPKFKALLESLQLDFEEAKKFFNAEMIFKLNGIPLNLSSFLIILNTRVDISKPCEILKRDKECESIWNIMLKKNKRNAVLIGEAGVGKSALIEKITYDIESSTSPDEFKDFMVISLDVNSLIAGTTLRGKAEERISDLIKFLENNSNIILFIDEVHTILGAGSCYEGEMDLANALKPILARGDTIVIGATTSEEYKKYFKSDAALSRRFESVEVDEPLAHQVYPMIKNKLDVLSDFHGVRISKQMVNYAVLIANCFSFDKKNPDKTLDLVDRAMVTAKRSKKKFVDKVSILRNFNIFFEEWECMSEESKKAVAYHEAGHYIVTKVSEYLTDKTLLAISIMPAEDYVGITVMEPNRHSIPLASMSYYIDEIASDLAGRVAEKLYTNEYTSSAREDLKRANTIAYNVVAKLGLLEDSNSFKNRIYLDFEDGGTMFSEKTTNIINDEVTKLIDKAYQRAEYLITQNQDILEAIVAALLEKHIISETELDKIWKKTVNARNK